MNPAVFLTELIGTFILCSVILSVVNNSKYAGVAPLAIGLALTVAVYFGNDISGGHFNPAVTTMVFGKGGIDSSTAVVYIIAQILGAICALYYYKNFNKQL